MALLNKQLCKAIAITTNIKIITLIQEIPYKKSVENNLRTTFFWREQQ